MDMTAERPGDTGRDAAVLLGLRAQWLHAQLNQPAMEIAAPRDRELLTMVATSTYGVARSALVDLQRRLGTTTPGSAGRWVDQMVSSGWLEAAPDADPTDPRIDLPQSVREEISHRAAALNRT